MQTHGMDSLCTAPLVHDQYESPRETLPSVWWLRVHVVDERDTIAEVGWGRWPGHDREPTARSHVACRRLCDPSVIDIRDHRLREPALEFPLERRVVRLRPNLPEHLRTVMADHVLISGRCTPHVIVHG